MDQLFHVYPLFDLTPVSATGCELATADGSQYLDLYGGHAVISVGHSHPHYINCLTRQLEQLVFYSNSVQSPLQKELAHRLTAYSGYTDYKVFLVNSGAEANENALKLASFSNGRSKVVAFSGSFHGRTAGALAVTDNPKLRAPINTQDQVLIHPWNQIEGLEQVLSNRDVSAVIIEGIQGISGIHVPSPDFMQQLRDLCDGYGTYLILDEIQSGYGRTGKFFAHQHTGIKADIITMAKGMGNGFPIGGVLISPDFEAVPGQLGTTFGGNHLGCTAGLAVLDILEREKLLDNAASIGTYLKSQLQDITEIKEVRGEGLMLGFTLSFKVKALREHLLHKEKIFVGSSSDPYTLRLLPPLCVNRSQVDLFIESLKKSLKHEELLINK
ncbi:MAG: aminotransferase class III-fold pyridoxal phosphate-dependent enzyme [Cyclobacteriaceae bacterium]|nr:aminotransferase class III-fold pyridoxal phosphate-dependent enzyme [Cyclobacteriaceae bacterium]